MKDALLLAPNFMGYDKCIENALMERYNVKRVNNEFFLPDMQARFDGIPFINRQIRKLKHSAKRDMEKIAEDYTEKYLELVSLEEKKYDLVICINGHYLSDDFYKQLRNRNKDAPFVLFLWDDISNILRSDHLLFFDRVFSYNIEDCKNRGLRYLPMFTQKVDIAESIDYSMRKYDIAVVGTAHQSRLRFIERLYRLYKESFQFFIYFYHPNNKVDFFGHDKPMDYSEYMEVLRNSRTVIDFPSENQTGPTTRFFDAMLTGTKVVTTNEHIRQYPFFNDNVCVIDKQSPVITDDFVNLKYNDLNNKYLYYPEEWLDCLIGDKQDL